MKQFLKDMCGKLTVSALNFYKQQKIQQFRFKVAAIHRSTVKNAANGILAYFALIMIAGLCTAGCVLLPLAFVFRSIAHAMQNAAENATLLEVLGPALGDAFVPLLVCGLLYVFLPVFGFVILTREGVVRKMAKADATEQKIRGQ